MKRFGASMALGAASLLVAFVMVEAGLRLYATTEGALARDLRASDPYRTKVEPHGRWGYRPRAFAEFTYPRGTRARENAAGWRGPLVDVPKPAGTRRVLLLGESTTHGWGVNDDETIDAFLRAGLAARWPGLRVDVVNLAFDGYDAYQIWQRLLSDGVRLEPDVIILNTGVNDVRNARYDRLGDPDPRTLLWRGELRRLEEERARGGPALWTRAKHYLFAVRLGGVMRTRSALARAVPVRDEVVHDDAADNFARNVVRVADVAARLGVPLLLSTPPSVLTREGGPAVMEPRSYWVAGPRETQRYRDTLAARLVAITGARSAAGEDVRYVRHDLPPAVFLDDCHLTAEGNRLMAVDFLDALATWLAPPTPSAGRGRRG